MLMSAVKEIGSGLILGEAGGAWLTAQLVQMTGEQQKEMMEMQKMEMEKKESVYEKMMDDYMKMFSF